MEQDKEKSTSLLDKRVGHIEKKRLAPSQITIVGIKEKTEKSEGVMHKVPLVQLLCQHPDKPDAPIIITKVKLIVDEMVVTKTTWADIDEEGNIQKDSALDDLLKFLECDCLADTEGKKLHTVVESKNSSFLCLKLFD